MHFTAIDMQAPNNFSVLYNVVDCKPFRAFELPNKPTKDESHWNGFFECDERTRKIKRLLSDYVEADMERNLSSSKKQITYFPEMTAEWKLDGDLLTGVFFYGSSDDGCESVDTNYYGTISFQRGNINLYRTTGSFYLQWEPEHEDGLLNCK